MLAENVALAIVENWGVYMQRHSQVVVSRFQGGAVAVEAALMMALILIPLLLFMLLFGKFFWYYTAAQKAAHDAALYMAQAPLSEIKNRSVVDLAESIASAEVADMDMAAQSTLSLTANCGYMQGNRVRFINCNGVLAPVAVQAAVVLMVTNPFGAFGIGTQQLPITSIVEMPFVGVAWR